MVPQRSDGGPQSRRDGISINPKLRLMVWLQLHPNEKIKENVS